MDSHESKEKLDGKVFPRSAPHGHELVQMVTKANADEWPKGKVELDCPLRWEDEGGQISNRVDEG
jgi:hypothetical protein